MQTLIAFWNILRKDIENYYLKPPNISWGLYFRFPGHLCNLSVRRRYRNEGLLPGLMAMSVLFGLLQCWLLQSH